MPEKPPFGPPPSEPGIVFVGPEDDFLDESDAEKYGWTKEMVSRVRELQKKYKEVLPPKWDIDVLHILREMHPEASDVQLSGVHLKAFIDAEHALKRGEAPKVRAEEVLRIYQKMYEIANQISSKGKK